MLVQVVPATHTTGSLLQVGECSSAEDKESVERSCPPRPAISEDTEELEEE